MLGGLIHIPSRNTEQGYSIPYSADFNGSTDYLSRLLSAGDDLEAWTLSYWAKQDVNNSNQWIFSAGGDDWVGFLSSNKFGFNVTSSNYRLATTGTYAAGTWRYFCVTWDSGNATSGDRMRVSEDGTRISSFSTENQPPINQTGPFNSATTHQFCKLVGASQYFDGHLADVRFIDGLSLDSTAFLTDEGTPKVYNGPYGSNGFYLDFADAGDLGSDVSGNGNDFTVTGSPARSTDVPS
jgi:hypothetical protein